MKAVEFRGMEDAVLVDELASRKKQVIELRCTVALGEEVRPHMLRKLRREIARIETIQSERRLAAAGENA